MPFIGQSTCRVGACPNRALSETEQLLLSGKVSLCNYFTAQLLQVPGGDMPPPYGSVILKLSDKLEFVFHKYN